MEPRRNVKVSLLLVTVIFSASVQGGVIDLPGYGLDDLKVKPLDLNALLGTDLENVLQKTIIPYYMEDLFQILREFPNAAPMLLDDVKSEQCKGHVMQWIARITNIKDMTEKDAWVWQMLDAWGKPPEGVLSGHVNALGDFDECVDIGITDLEKKPTTPSYDTPKKFEGRYCNTYFVPYNEKGFGHFFDKTRNITEVFSLAEGRKAVSPAKLVELMSIMVGVNLLPSMGICFPNSCDQTDMQQVMMNAFQMIYAPTLENPDVHVTKEMLIWPSVQFCYEGKKPDLDAADISVIALLGIIFALVLGSTILDIALNRGLDKPPRRGLPFQYLNSFSLYTNIPKWLSTRPSADDLGCLHGIRFLSTSWVILAHTWYVITFIPYFNMVDVKTIQDNWMILTILNSTVSVDTFFVISGLLVAYNVLKMLQKTKGKLNIPMFYIHRYLRLTPVYAVLVGVMATILPYVGRGPYWFIMDRWAHICEDNWWTNLLYVNNFVNTSWLCQGEAWYLANDMQFYIVSPIFLLPLYHWETIGLILLAILTILSSLSPALMVYFMETVPTTIGTRDSQKWFLDIYIKPYARIQTYFVGVWLGWILFKTKGKRVKLPWPVVVLFWIISTGSCLSVIYGIQEWFDPLHEIPRASGAVYAGMSRLAWSMSISWIIFACCKGYGWIINDFLSWKAFIPLGRLCYCVYLVSLHLQMVLHVQFKQPIPYSDYTMVNFFFGHMIMAFMVGFLFTITVETPFMQLEKLLFEGGGGRGAAAGAGKNPTVSGLPPGSTDKDGNSRNGLFYNSTEAVLNGEANPKQE